MRFSTMAGMSVLIMMLLSISLVSACGENEEASQTNGPTIAESQQHCPDFNPQRNVYFGELHAHTALSYDAYIMGIRIGPRESYDFAKGGEIRLPPYGEDGSGGRPVKLSRPLDFAAITDHSEYLAEVYYCTTLGNPAFDTPLCQRFREDFVADVIYEWADHQDDVGFGDVPVRWEEICQQPGIDCRQKVIELWQNTVQTAEDACEECSFTAFPGYEYTRAPNSANLHRNIIFRNSNVIEYPLSGYEFTYPNELWGALTEQCLDSDNDCDFISIPHNSNWSNGRMFTPDYAENQSIDEQREAAALRAEIEPLVEIYQVKGWMECRNGFSGNAYDPLCDCEKTRSEDAPHCQGVPGVGGVKDEGCVSRYDFIRNVLKLGLIEEIRTGVNPYKVGIIGSTDTHSANPGQVAEYNYAGNSGMLDGSPGIRISSIVQDIPIKFNPGGLTAVWAEENKRDAIFAMPSSDERCTQLPAPAFLSVSSVDGSIAVTFATVRTSLQSDTKRVFAWAAIYPKFHIKDQYQHLL